jgi:hypothetical protein
MKRLSKELENNDKRIQSLKDSDKHLKDELKEIKNNSDTQMKKYDLAIKDIIETTSDTSIQMRNTLEVDLSDETFKDELFNSLKEQINKIKPNKNNEESLWLSELRNYISKTLLSFLEILYKHINLENSMSMQKLKWQQTLDQLVLTHEEELNISKFYILKRFFTIFLK